MTKTSTASNIKVSTVGSHKMITLDASATKQTHGGAGQFPEYFEEYPPVTFYG